jgi:peptidoglycan/xylan/chitin deacetylase (PgdA/CDA1 family)
MIAILAYHSLDDSNSVLSTSPRVFADQMRTLRDSRINIISLEQISEQLRAGSERSDAVAITFDDGFRSVYEHALPVLQTYGLPATVFLVTDYCEKTNAWPGQPAYIERQPLLRWSEINEMAQAGISFGSHTRAHPNLRELSRDQAEEELAGSKRIIEDTTGRPVDTFAYPYGAYNDVVVQLARQHFRLACSTVLGFAGSDSDPFALERLDMYYLQSPALFRRLFSPPVVGYIGVRRWLRHLRSRRKRVE